MPFVNNTTENSTHLCVETVYGQRKVSQKFYPYLDFELAEETRNLLVQNTRTEAGALPPGDDPAYDDVPPDHAGTKDGDDEGAAGELAAVAGEQPSQQFTDLNAMFAEMEEDDKTEAGRHKMELQQYVVFGARAWWVGVWMCVDVCGCVWRA